MNSTERAALRTIRDNLKSGLIYGKDVFRWPSGNGPRFPYFSEAIEYRPQPGRHPGYFRWHNYGSSASRATLPELAWIIKTIFDTTPSAFLTEYITNDKSRIPEARPGYMG